MSKLEQKEQDANLIYALDIGTRSVIGMVGEIVGERFQVIAIEKEEHGKRAMLDGQIDDIEQVAALVRAITDRLEEKTGVHFTSVCVAAAGRALRTEQAHFRLELSDTQSIGDEEIRRLEMGAVSAAEESLQKDEETQKQFFLVGYIAAQYRLDHYPMTTLKGHNGQVLEVDLVATFLPSEVVESLYTTMRSANLQVASMTLEPIAAMNAVIPADLRLLNLALVDIGAGTSDIAICKDGSIVGYTMVTLAGDEITEAIMKAFLTDFQTAEEMKQELVAQREIRFTDILGMTLTVTAEELYAAVEAPMNQLTEEVAKQILSVNGGAPSALFLAGGGSKLKGLQGRLAECLGMDQRRVAVAGNNFDKSAFSEEYTLKDPEYATPLGIAVSAGLGLTNDSYVVRLNGQNTKLFRNGLLTLQEVLFMNGYTGGDLIGKTGQNLSVTLDDRRMVFRGEPGVPAILRINGEDVTANALVHAGDAIDFVPAKHGVPAVKTLRDLLGVDFSGEVLVNNQEASSDQPLLSGDVIFTLNKLEPHPVAEVLSFDTAPDQAKPQKISQIAPDKPSTIALLPVRPVAGKPEPVPPESVKVGPVKPPAQPEPKPPVTQVEAVEEPSPAPKPAMQEARAPSRLSERRYYAPISVTLNGIPRLLQPKPEGAPHYLMDLLQFSGIDFERVDRPVLLLVNGEECQFRQIIQDQDVVVIRCNKED